MVFPMRFTPIRLLSFLGLITVLVFITACGSSGKKEYVFAPQVSIKELAKQGEQWQVTVMVNNLSNVTHTIEQVELDLSIGAQALGRLSHIERIDIPAQSSDPIVITHTINPSASAELMTAANQNMAIDYQLQGSIRSSEPDTRTDDVTAQGRLTVAPGLEATFR